MFLQSCCGLIQEAKRSHRAQLTGRLSSRHRLSRSENRARSASSQKVTPPDDGFLLGGLASQIPMHSPHGPVPEAWYNQVTEVWTSNEDFMPFKKALQKSPSMVATGQRSAVRAAEESLAPPLGDPTAPKVTEENIMLSLRVVRGEDWQWGDEDGGNGYVGLVLSFDPKSLTAQVLWEKTCQAHSHYRYGTRNQCDLRVFTQLLPTPYLGRRNSQEFFASKFQTMIVLDWDDTKLKEENASKLAICQSKVVDLLRQANSVGKVILVTLARKPWVFDSCRNFFPTVGQAIRELNVPIIYAQEVAAFDYNKGHAMSTPPEVERFWSSMKAKAIARECKNFYSQYDGQSWKNVISIGDSDFERIGTMLATQDYMQQTGIQSGAAAVVDDHVYKVRTKTLKMIEQPSLDELNTQLGLLRSWLPHMIKLDSDFDLNLNTASDPTVLKRITATLLGESSEADSSPMSPDT